MHTYSGIYTKQKNNTQNQQDQFTPCSAFDLNQALESFGDGSVKFMMIPPNASKEPDLINSERYSVLFDGEVYNSEELFLKYNVTGLDSNAGLILYIYENLGYDALSDIDGFFIAYIYDKSTRKLAILNDRYGLKKLFFYNGEDCFIFGPKIEYIERIYPIKKSLDRMSAMDFFRFGYILNDKTLIAEISRLPRASILEVTDRHFRHDKYWDFKFSEDYDDNHDEELLVQSLEGLWIRAMERHLPSKGPFVIPLSGGLDSRAILVTSLKLVTADNIAAFTYGPKESYNAEISRLVAKKTGVKHYLYTPHGDDFESEYFFELSRMEGLATSTILYSIDSFLQMKEYSSILISGFMGDNQMGSHLNSSMMQHMQSQHDLTKAESIIKSIHCKTDIERLFCPSFLNGLNVDESFKMSLRHNCHANTANFCDYWDFTQRQQNLIKMGVVQKFEDLYTYRLPFLDNDLLDFMLAIPPALRLNQKLYRSMLLRLDSDVFALPTTQRLGLPLHVREHTYHIRRIKDYLIDRCLNRYFSAYFRRTIRQKRECSYRDYDTLLRLDDSYAKFVEAQLSMAKRMNCFNASYIDDKWDLHMTGSENNEALFGLLITFRMFCDKYDLALV